MRNLKRALSLALASVMLLGMMVVGTSAASYPDVDENDNVEAIEVLNAVNVMIGRQGNFEPDELVNRHEMAVIMAKLVLGVDTADNYVGTHPFTDVVPWADKYVAACYENDLISGTSATTYSGSQPLTAVQAALMMLRALGYKDLNKGATDWRAPITAMANQIRLFNGVASNPNDKLNRNQVAQLALNTLKSPMVNLVDNTITWNSNEGQVIMASGGRQYIALSSREAYARAINRVESAGTSASQIGGWTVELGEHLYNGDLKLNDVTDPFQRPARQWEYDGKEIGTYIKEELLDFEKVGEVTGKDLYEVLGKTAIDEYTMIVALDGVTDPAIVRDARRANGFAEYDGDTNLGSKHNQNFVFDAADLNRSNKGSVGATGTGVLTQVFVDPNYDNGGSNKDGRIWIAVINTYLARATQDYDARREELALNAYSVDKYKDEFVALPQDGTVPETVRLGVEEYPVVKDADKDDAFLVTFAEGEVQTIVPAEVMEAVTISSFKKNSNVVVDGTKYDFTTTAGFDAKTLKAYTGDAVTNLKDSTYNVFLDAYGNTIGVQEVDAKKNYVFLAAIDINDSNLVNGTADAKAVFLDGTVDTIRVNLDKSDLDYYTKNAEPGGYNKNSILNTWCTYTVNNSNVYTVKQVMDINAKGDTFVPGYTWTNAKGEKVNNNDTGLAQYHQTGFTAANEKIDKKHITLQGNTTNTGSYARVYGNEKTVYLNAELTNLTNQGGIWGVVKDVDSVTTGAENVNLTVWSDTVAKEAAETTTIKLDGLAYATKGVYTLYDDDGIVIAAVVAGEDDGSARNLVYVHSSSIDSESYNGSSASRAAGDGLWTWTRKVIRNGEEVTLTEVSDGNSELNMMQQYHWYQIKTNADGEVTGVYELPDDDTTKLKEANLTHYKDYALTYKPHTYTEDGVTKTLGEIAYTVQKGSSTVLYWNQAYINSHLYMNGRTLYVATDDQTGFIVNSNVKWVVQQWDNNKKETYIDDGTTAAGLKNMIDEINRRHMVNGAIINYPYQVSAVIESGIASSVIIHFNENDYNRPDRPVTGTTKMDFNRATGVWTLTVPVDDDKVDDLTITQIRDYLLDAGCTDIVNNGKLWSFVWEDIPAEKVELNIVGQTPATKYAITIDKGITNGTVEADVASAAEGATVTVTATPASGYKTSSIEVDGKALTVTNDKATFKMPAKAVTVKATFVKEVKPAEGLDFDPAGTAVEGTDFTAAKNADGTYTITAENGAVGVMVYDVQGCTVAGVTGKQTIINSKVYTEWTVDPAAGAEKVIVRVNRMIPTFGDNNNLITVEDGTAPAALEDGKAAKAAAANATGENTYFEVTFKGLTVDGKKDPTYTVAKVPGVDGLVFGKGFDAAAKQALLNGIMGAGKEGFTLGLGLLDPTKPADKDKIDEWTGDKDDKPGDLPKSYQKESDNSLVITWYDSSTATDCAPAESRIKSEAGRLLGKTIIAVDVATSGIPSTAKIFYDGGNQTVTLERYWKVTVDGATTYVKDSDATDIDVTSGWKYYMDEAKPFAKENVAGGLYTVASKKIAGITLSRTTGDLTLVKAVNVKVTQDGASAAGIIVSRTVKGTLTDIAVTDLATVGTAATDGFVPVGVELTLSAQVTGTNGSAVKGSTVGVNVKNRAETKKVFEVAVAADQTNGKVTTTTGKYTIKEDEVIKGNYSVEFESYIKGVTLDFNGTKVDLLKSDEANLDGSSTITLPKGTDVAEGYYIPVDTKVDNGMSDDSFGWYLVKKNATSGNLELVGKPGTATLTGTAYLNKDKSLRLLPAVLLLVDSDADGKLATKSVNFSDDSGTVKTLKTESGMTNNVYATSGMVVTLENKAAGGMTSAETVAYNVNKDAARVLTAGTDGKYVVKVSDLAGTAKGEIKVVFTVAPKETPDAVVADVNEEIVNVDKTKVVGNQQANVNDTDPGLADQQKVSIAADKKTINVTQGITKDWLKESSEGNEPNKGKFMGLNILGNTAADWRFDDKYDSFVVLAFKAPEGIETTVSNVSDVISGGTMTMKTSGAADKTWGVDLYNKDTGVAYILFGYESGKNLTRVFSIEWALEAGDTMTCEYTVNFN